MVEKRMNQHIPPSVSVRGLTDRKDYQWDKSYEAGAVALPAGAAALRIMIRWRGARLCACPAVLSRLINQIL